MPVRERLPLASPPADCDESDNLVGREVGVAFSAGAFEIAVRAIRSAKTEKLSAERSGGEWWALADKLEFEPGWISTVFRVMQNVPQHK